MRASRFAFVLSSLLLAGAALAALAGSTHAAVHTLMLGPGYATASNASASTARAFTGTGSWYESYPSSKTEFYLDAATQLGGGFTVDQIASITYHTVNGATNPSGVDFFAVIYTQPFVGGDAGWYGRRLNAEPYLSNGYVPPTAWAWNAWATPAGANQLTWFDANHCGNFGFYGAPTLADLQAGPITWATWPGNPTAGSAEATPFDYGAQPVKFLSFQTGSGWSAFDGYLDAITIALTTGETYVLDLESSTDPLYVDAAWTGAVVGTEVVPGRWIGWNAFAKVQDAVASAIPGGTIHVAAGTYTEQVVVNGKNLTIVGAGRALTTIQSPVTMTTSYTTSAANFPVVFAQNATNVVVRDLTVDGAGRGNSNYRFQGVAFWNAGGKLLDCDVKRIEDTPFSGAQHGVAVAVNSNTAGPYAFEMGGCNVTDFQKNGTAFTGTGLTLNVHDCTITGAGATTVTAQNGLQAGALVAATIANTTVGGCYWNGTPWTATGMLLYAIPSLTVSGGSVSGSQSSIYAYDCSGSITGCNVSLGTAAFGAWGVGAYNFNTTLAAKAGGRTPPAAQPFDAELGGASAKLATSFTMTVSGGCITGPGVAGTTGVDVWSDGGLMTANVSGAEITGWDYGVGVGGAGGVTVNATGNAITGNLTAGYWGDVGLTHNATNNWWGSNLGPGAGGANPAVGPVSYTPWLLTGSDLTPGCGFSPGPPNTIAPQAPVGCITPATACVAIPVTIARTDALAMRAFSVDVTLSSNLTLCGTSFAAGTYLLGLPNFEWYANGPNTWTVDGASLGLPCGATDPSGVLFTLYVASTAPTGTGTVTLSNAQLRDCDNGPLAAGVGGAATITIDNTAPAAVSALVAAPRLTGNDTNGTTKIGLTFTAPGDAAAVKVYRAPFGSYPEYDDAGGAPPAAPGAYPPASPWTLTGVTATGQADEPATRDWWYYVAYAQDACGNWSAASNVTTGTLNYHLGDVSDGYTAGQGDNAVGWADVSLLGFNYGATLIPSDARNYLDVGPTTNMSPLGRPTTDNRVNFEDLMMFALNYGQVGLPNGPQNPHRAGDADAIALRAPAAVEPGATFEVGLVLHGAGDLQGLSAMLAWDAAVAEPVSVRAGELLAASNGVAFSPEPGGVDVAVLGAGATLTGDGVLATVTFRARTAGDPRVRLASVEGRDTQNRPVTPGVMSAPAPVATALAAAQPNPFRGTTTIAWSLAKPGNADLAVFSVDGRRVRTLESGEHEAGTYRVRWNGADDQGHALSAGVYFVRLRTVEGVQRRSIVLVP